MTTTLRTILSDMARLYGRWGYTLRLTSGDRSVAEQDALYRAGKTRLPGGSSKHNRGEAADLVPGKRWPRNQVTQADSFRSIASVAREFGLQAVVERDHVHVEIP